LSALGDKHRCDQDKGRQRCRICPENPEAESEAKSEVDTGDRPGGKGEALVQIMDRHPAEMKVLIPKKPAVEDEPGQQHPKGAFMQETLLREEIADIAGGTQHVAEYDYDQC
jgi:hypothetical protein